MEEKKEKIKEAADVFYAIASENRLKVIKELEKGPKTWSELMFSLKMNPRILDESLKKLMKAGIIIKKSGKYRLTGLGDYILQIIEPIAQLAVSMISSIFKSFSVKTKEKEKTE